VRDRERERERGGEGEGEGGGGRDQVVHMYFSLQYRVPLHDSCHF